MRRASIIRALGRFSRREDGGALVEFGMILPIVLIIFAVTIEASRTFWAYQATLAGVRDAVRYVGRTVRNDICIEGGNLDHVQAEIEDIVRNSADGTTLFPSSISVVWVASELTCHHGSFRMSSTPVVQISAKLHITYPMQSLFEYVGLEIWPVDTIVRDQSRVFGA